MISYNRRLTENFNLNEFINSYDYVRVSGNIFGNIQSVAVALQYFRYRINEPIYIISGFRNPLTNLGCGGVKLSYHLDGLAADIYYKNIEKKTFEKFKILKTFFSGIIWYPDKLIFHCDLGNRDSDRPYYRFDKL